MEKKTVAIHCSKSLGGGISLYLILKQLDDGSHYYISKDVYKGSGSFQFTKSDCRFAAVSILQLLWEPGNLIYTNRIAFGQTFSRGSRGICKDERLNSDNIIIHEEFNHADELYERLVNYDKAKAALSAEYVG